MGNRDSGIPAITRGIAHVEKTSSTSMGPLSVGDGMDGASSMPVSLTLGMETRETVSWSMEPKAPSNVLISEDVLQPTRAIWFFPDLHISV